MVLVWRTNVVRNLIDTSIRDYGSRFEILRVVDCHNRHLHNEICSFQGCRLLKRESSRRLQLEGKVWFGESENQCNRCTHNNKSVPGGIGIALCGVDS